MPATMTYNNGPLLANVELQGVYMKGWDTNPTLQTQQTTLDTYMTDLAGSTYLDLLSQYSVTSPTAYTIGHGTEVAADTNYPAPSVTTAKLNDGNTYNNVITDGSIRTMLSAEIAANRITPDANKLFVVFLPPGNPEQSGGQDSTSNFFAYHWNFHDSGSNKDVYYAVIPYPGSPNLTYTPLTTIQLIDEAMSHEISESVTDPSTGTGWFQPALGTSGEVGDLSNLSYSTLDGYTVQNEFSNATNAAAVPSGASFYISSLANPTEGKFNGVIATYVDTTGDGSLSFATVNWGDGTPTAGGLTFAKVGPNTYTISGSHTFTGDEGTQYNFNVWLTTTDGRQAHRYGQIGIQDSSKVNHNFNDLGLVTSTDAALAPIPVTVPGTEGQAISGAVVGKFNDPGTDGTTNDYSATITWTDSSGTTHSTTGNVVLESGTTFDVTGSSGFNYAEEGAYPITVAVNDKGGSTTTISSTAKIIDPQVSAMGGFTVGALEGMLSASQTVATFTDPGGPEAVGDYSALIDWGDGQTSAGVISGPVAGVYTVQGSHNYAEESAADHPGSNPYTIMVTISHDSAPNVVVQSSAIVGDQSVQATGGYTVTHTEGMLSASQTVATFIDPGGPEAVGDYSALIDWGDGHTSAGVISGPVAGVYTVQGSHNYAEESTADHPGSNPYTIMVTISHETSAPVLAFSSAVVKDPSVVAMGGFTVNALECQAFAGLAVATFTDPGGPEPLGDYSALIDWGDGHTSAGVISGPVAGVYTVSGGNTFGEDGSYSIKVTLHHETSTNVTVAGTAVVHDNIGILLLDPTGSGALTATGNAAVTVSDANNCGAIVINSSSPSAGIASGNAVVTAGEYDITGVSGTHTSGHGAFVYGDELNNGESPTVDPLAGIPTPPNAGPPNAVVNDSGGPTLMLWPGTYNGGIHVSGKGSVFLNPGVYYLNGGGFSVSGQGSVSGDGVTIYNAPTKNSDGFSFSGQAVVRLTGQTTGVDQSIVFFQNPTSTAQFQVSGNASLNLSGIIYAADAAIQVSGQAVLLDQANAARTVAAEIDAFDLTVSGNGVVDIDVTNNSVESLRLGASDVPAMAMGMAMAQVATGSPGSGSPALFLATGNTAASDLYIAPDVLDDVAADVASIVGTVLPTNPVAQSLSEKPLLSTSV